MSNFEIRKRRVALWTFLAAQLLLVSGLSHAQSENIDIDKLLPPDQKSSLRTGFNAILDQKDDVPAVMMSLLLLSIDAREKKVAAPRYNLCDLNIMINTKFCHLNKGIQRINMPQLMGKPIPGGKADVMAKGGKVRLNAAGEVDLQDEFQAYLKNKGYEITQEDVDAFDLKATQSELVGGNVAGMWFALKINPQNGNIRAPIFVSSDNYVLDGHHRWAAVMCNEFGLAKDIKPFRMPVLRINADINKLLDLSAEFLREYGIEVKAG